MSALSVDPVITSSALLEHWQGHRRVTRRVIQAFPAEQLFRFSIGSMRPFGLMAFEIASMTAAGVEGLATGKWPDLSHHQKETEPTSQDQILKLWDETTARMNELWPQIRPGRFQEVDTAFGQYTGEMGGILLYWIDNEIHHRGQGYVYLRALGVEPPAFYDR
jgi:uncharacterized damage-inducible protein DinB